jgi:hypothetical protein
MVDIPSKQSRVRDSEVALRMNSHTQAAFRGVGTGPVNRSFHPQSTSADECDSRESL